jgi:hypothetical protein
MEGSEYLTDMRSILESIKHFSVKILRQKLHGIRRQKLNTKLQLFLKGFMNL